MSGQALCANTVSSPSAAASSTFSRRHPASPIDWTFSATHSKPCGPSTRRHNVPRAMRARSGSHRSARFCLTTRSSAAFASATSRHSARLPATLCMNRLVRRFGDKGSKHGSRCSTTISSPSSIMLATEPLLDSGTCLQNRQPNVWRRLRIITRRALMPLAATRGRPECSRQPNSSLNRRNWTSCLRRTLSCDSVLQSLPEGPLTWVPGSVGILHRNACALMRTSSKRQSRTQRPCMRPASRLPSQPGLPGPRIA